MVSHGRVEAKKETNFLLFPQSKKTNTGDLHNLEADTGNITLGLSSATETGDENLVVLIDEVEATIILHKNLIHTGSEAESMNARARKQ